jgi:hypothetical protein
MYADVTREQYIQMFIETYYYCHAKISTKCFYAWYFKQLGSLIQSYCTINTYAYQTDKFLQYCVLCMQLLL